MSSHFSFASSPPSPLVSSKYLVSTSCLRTLAPLANLVKRYSIWGHPQDLGERRGIAACTILLWEAGLGFVFPTRNWADVVP